MSERLAGKVALVTGAASGIGRAASAALVAEGALVVATDVDEASLAELGRDLPAADTAALDVTDEAAWIATIEAIERRHGRLDVLVNNAGIGLVADVEGTSLDDWRRIHAVNLDGTFLGCKHALGAMRRAGGGAIVNVSSVSGLVGGHNLAAYCSSKGAVRLLTKSVALHCARQRLAIRCNSLHPSFVDTPILDGLVAGSADPTAAKAGLARQIPLGRLGRPEEVAAAIVYLASDASAFMTGAELVLDGGLTAM